MKKDPLKIIVVEDEAELRQTISTVLEVAGYEVLSFDTGEKALAAIGAVRPYTQVADMLITDIAMPAMSGIELVRNLRNRSIQIPVMVITACGTKETVIDMLRLGVRDIIEKPFNAGVLCSRVANIANQARNCSDTTAPDHDKNIQKVLHDFKNWLGAIMGLAEFLTVKNPTPPSAIQLDEISRYAAHIMHAARLSVQTLEKIQTPAGAPLDVNINSAILDTLAILGRKIPCRITVITSLEAAEATISGDETDVRNLLLNLILNALQAMGEQGTMSISTRNEYIGDRHRLILDISDSGCGMTEEVQAKIFEPGFSTNGGANRGFGLAHARWLVNNWGGLITVISQSGTGTTFSLDFPVKTHPVASTHCPGRLAFNNIPDVDIPKTETSESLVNHPEREQWI
jgi:signal transduction histidine kinase